MLVELPSFRDARDVVTVLEKRKCENGEEKKWKTIVLLCLFFVL